jgi:hypothetical protein
VFFTFGHIGETLEGAMKTVELMERYAKYIDPAAYGVCVRIYPGTEVEQLALAQGFLPKDFTWDQPYFDQKIEALGTDYIIPIVLQPQFGWKEFRKLELRLKWFLTNTSPSGTEGSVGPNMTRPHSNSRKISLPVYPESFWQIGSTKRHPHANNRRGFGFASLPIFPRSSFEKRGLET